VAERIYRMKETIGPEDAEGFERLRREIETAQAG
jgi:hypothetical protein